MMDSGRMWGPGTSNDVMGMLSPHTGGKPKDSAELQKLLLDERMRCETHKMNYETLKEQHSRLRTEYAQMEEQVHQITQNGSQSSNQLQELINSLQKQLAATKRELEEVRSQTLHPHKLELMKAEITKELEEPLRAHMVAMDKEVEKYREDYNKIRYEHTFLKAEYEHMKNEHQRNIEEVILRHKAEVSALAHERDTLLNNQKSTTDVDSQKLLQLQRQKVQLEQRIKNLLDELTEVRKQKEHASNEADLVQRSQSKDITQLNVQLKAIESEKRSCDLQCERLQKELRDSGDQINRFTTQLTEKNKECASLKNMFDEETHRHKVALTSHKMELLKLQGSLERERDGLVTKVQELESELDLARGAIDRHQRELEEAEREALIRVQQVQEEEWGKTNEMQGEKMGLEGKCKELGQRLSEERLQRSNEREQHEEQMRRREEEEGRVKMELAELKIHLEHETKTVRQLERDRDECATLRIKLHEREKEIQELTLARHQVVEESQRANETIRTSKVDLDAMKMKVQKAQMEAEKAIEENKISALQEKHRLQSRIDQLEFKLTKTTETLEKNKKQQKKWKQSIQEKVRSLNRKTELLEAQKEQLEIETKAGKHGVSMEEHNRTRRRIRELKRRHEEFRRVVGMSDNLPLMTSTMNLRHDMTAISPIGLADMTNVTFKDQGLRHQDEVALLRQRLDEVAKQQQQQMEALDNYVTKSDHDVTKGRTMQQGDVTEAAKNESVRGSYDYDEDFEGSENSKIST
uniref:centrosomal protein of 83 kDa n=1 Tax=Ciona intestinalis TaxID=7719 RepID=UPI0000523DD4|nr:centrosomal protein of 83 kDa [Ciona intestinalis]|eukprot:XP_002120930.1 centrosomal protein of 83 kDa [Ciona intestinalis]